MKTISYILFLVIAGALACLPDFAVEAGDMPAHWREATMTAGQKSDFGKIERPLPAKEAAPYVHGLNQMPARNRSGIPKANIARVPLKNSVNANNSFTPFHHGNQPGAGKPVGVGRKQPMESEIITHSALPIHPAGAFTFPTSPNVERAHGAAPAAIGGAVNSPKGTAVLNGTGMKRHHFP